MDLLFKSDAGYGANTTSHCAQAALARTGGSSSLGSTPAAAETQIDGCSSNKSQLKYVY